MMVVLPVSIEAYLRETGFTSTEIILIRRLLADKSLTLREIASKTGKSTGVLDQALKKLIQKKIISKEGVNGQPKYSLLSLGALAEWVEQGCRGKLELEKKRHQNFQSFIASIGQEHQRPQMQHFEGREGVEKAYGMLLENPELLVYMPVSGSEEDDPMMPVRQALRRKRTARHVATRVLAPATSAGKRYRNRDVFESRETRLLTEQQCPILYEKVIAGDCVLYINHLESRACLMHYPELAHTERRMFEALWKEGKMDGVVVGSGQASSGKEPGANALAAPMVSVFASFWEQLMLMSVFWKICAACALLLFVTAVQRNSEPLMPFS